MDGLVPAPFLPLTRVPRLVAVAAPALDERLRSGLARERQALVAHPDHFDGPQLIALRATAEVIECYQGSYAHYRLISRLGPRAGLGLGPVGVGLLLAYEDEELWVRRSEHVDQPGSWCFAVAGGVRQLGDDVVGTVLKEAHEELGLRPQDLLGLQPLALLPDYGGYVLFRARLRPGAVLCPNPQEVAETAFIDDWSALRPLDPFIRAIRERASLAV